MFSTLFIAEKPSMARAIADVLGVVEKKKTHIVCKGDTIVTWCLGHLYEFAPPESYLNGDKEWKLDNLPIIPKEWKRVVKQKTKQQLQAIKELVKKADVIVNAGDPDREGQLLVDEVIERADPPRTVQRIWLQALDGKSIRKAMKEIKDNELFLPLRLSAEARSRADWLVGMNFTRYFTVKAGVKKVISVGRVQTPTLALVVQRDEAIESFVPHDYYILKAVLLKNGDKFSAVFSPSKEFLEHNGSSFDEGKRLINKALAEEIARNTSNATAIVSAYVKSKETQQPPMPYYLATLQKMASSKYKLTASQTLQIAQSLYEKKLTTYPRTDCPYIAEEQHPDAANILGNLKSAGVLPEMVAKADPKVKHAAFNSKKITAHTAIIPTGNTKALSGLSKMERAIYDEIAKAYICLFMKPLIYNAVTAVFDIKSYQFKATGKEIVQLGFAEFCGGIKENLLPVLEKGERLQTGKTTIETKQTTPPPHFTDGTLIEAMSHIYRFIEDDRAKKTLKETDGIGTEATRAQIIDTLIQRGYMKRRGGKIVSTPFGKQVIHRLPDFIKDPVLTASWERGLKGIEAGKVKFAEFMRKQEEFVKRHVKEGYDFKIDNNALQESESIGKCACGGSIVETQKTYKCKSCGKYVFKTVFGKKLTQNQAVKLLQGKEIKVKGLKSKKGKKFEAKLKLVKDGEKWKTELEF